MAVDGQNEEGSIDGKFFDIIEDVFISPGRGHAPRDCQPENKADYKNLSSSRVHYDPLPVFLLKSSGNATAEYTLTVQTSTSEAI
jgi:hypothetical protein